MLNDELNLFAPFIHKKQALHTMSIQGLSSAANSALSGLNKIIRDVEQVAVEVAGGLQNASGESSTQSLSAFSRLPELKSQARANAQVLSTVQELLSGLTIQPRRELDTMNRRFAEFSILGFILATVLFYGRNAAADHIPADTATVTVHAADILRPQILSSPNYKIEDAVTVKQHRYVFRIKTRWGPLSADGMNMLALRLREMRAIERAKRLSRNSQVIGGVVESVSQTPQGVGMLLTNPIGAVLGIPQGVRRLASTKIDPADRRAGSVTRRRLAHEIGCDPETTNPILKPLLDNLATRKGLGQLVGKVGMSAAVPGLGLVPLSAEMQKSLLIKLPHEINADIDRELETLNVDKKTRQTFLASPHFTTGQRLALMSQLHELKAVESRSLLVQFAAQATSEADALAINDQLRMLAGVQRQRTITRIINVGLPAAVLEDGTVIAVCSADYLVATGELSAVLGSYRRNHSRNSLLLYCSGRFSPQAVRLFNQAGVQTVELR